MLMGSIVPVKKALPSFTKLFSSVFKRFLYCLVPVSILKITFKSSDSRKWLEQTPLPLNSDLTLEHWKRYFITIPELTMTTSTEGNNWLCFSGGNVGHLASWVSVTLGVMQGVTFPSPLGKKRWKRVLTFINLADGWKLV